MASYVFNGVSFEAPEGWIDGSIITLVSPSGPPNFRPNVIVTRSLREVDSFAAQVEAEMKEVRRAHKGLTQHRREERIVAGRPAIVLEYSYRSPESVVVRQQQVVIDDGTMVFMLTMSNREDAFERLRPEFERIIDTFTLG